MSTIMDIDPDSQFPFTLTIDIPFPDMRLASTALKVLSVDPELSPLVCRSITTISPLITHQQDPSFPEVRENILRTEYKSKTNRMLRVAFNGFMESLNVVIGAMVELDVDILGSNAVSDQNGHEPGELNSSSHS